MPWPVPVRTIVSFPAPSANRTGSGREMQPATDGRAEQARDVASRQEAADDGEPELEASDRRIEQLLGRGAERPPVHDQVPEARPDDGARDDPDRDERDVVGSQVTRPGEQTGHDERADEDGDERDRPPAHGQVAEQLDGGVEVEGDDGDRHGGDECIEGSPPDSLDRLRSHHRLVDAVGPPTRSLSVGGLARCDETDIIGPSRRSNAGGRAIWMVSAAGESGGSYHRTSSSGPRGHGPDVRFEGMGRRW